MTQKQNRHPKVPMPQPSRVTAHVCAPGFAQALPGVSGDTYRNGAAEATPFPWYPSSHPTRSAIDGSETVLRAGVALANGRIAPAPVYVIAAAHPQYQNRLPRGSLSVMRAGRYSSNVPSATRDNRLPGSNQFAPLQSMFRGDLPEGSGATTDKLDASARYHAAAARTPYHGDGVMQ